MNGKILKKQSKTKASTPSKEITFNAYCKQKFFPSVIKA